MQSEDETEKINKKLPEEDCARLEKQWGIREESTVAEYKQAYRSGAIAFAMGCEWAGLTARIQTKLLEGRSVWTEFFIRLSTAIALLILLMAIQGKWIDCSSIFRCCAKGGCCGDDDPDAKMINGH